MTIEESNPQDRRQTNRFGWFAAGGLTVAVLMSGFLYMTGYFSSAAGLQADAGETRNIIESKK